MAAWTTLAAGNFDFGVESGSCFFEGDFHFVAEIGAALSADTPPPALPKQIFQIEERSEQILESGKDRRGEIGGSSRATHRRESTPVICRALLGVREHAVSFRNLLETLFGFFFVAGIAV